METSFISNETNQRKLSKKAVLIAALAITAVIGVVATYSIESTNFALTRSEVAPTASNGTNSTNGTDEVVANDEFKKWSGRHKRKFGKDESKTRYRAWKDNRDKVNRHNKKNSSYIMEVNDFADLTPEEFAAVHLGGRPRRDPVNPAVAKLEAAFLTTEATYSESVDWRNTMRVGPVKNQGSCGSCWAFASVAVLEGANAKNTDKYVALSEQQLVDCANGDAYGSYGCNGGWPPSALQYAIKYGSASEASYPYTGVAGTCKTDVKSVYKPTKVINPWIPDDKQKRLDNLKQAIINGPSAVYVQADTRNFQFYKTGVFDKADCYSTGINHAVTAVGYDKDSFIIRNSWGPTWGENGYIRISQNALTSVGICGVAEWGAAYVV